jgi:hypothetical protein
MICDKMLENPEELILHIKIDHQEIEDEFNCSDCKRSFKFYQTFRNHRLIEHLQIHHY